MGVSCLPDAPAGRPSVLNLPNLLTVSRLVLAAVFFLFVALNWLATGLLLFVVFVCQSRATPRTTPSEYARQRCSSWLARIAMAIRSPGAAGP